MALSDQEILRTLMKSRDRIAAAAWMVVRDPHTAEDIFQNVAFKAIGKKVSFPAEGAVLSWAFITARREGIDWLRRHRKGPAILDSATLELLEQGWMSETAHHGDARIEALRQCLTTMPEKSRRLLRLRYFDGHNCQDVAEKLGAGLSAIYKRLSRLHQGLKECVELRLNEVES
ncbi:MAG: sigma-70 family RNA polymerase sigma factor [Pirellulaceae bacterium]